MIKIQTFLLISNMLGSIYVNASQTTPSCSLMGYSILMGVNKKDVDGPPEKTVYKFEANDLGKDSMYGGFLVEKSKFPMAKNSNVYIQLIQEKEKKAPKITKLHDAKIEEWIEDKNYFILSGIDLVKINKMKTERPTSIQIALKQNNETICTQEIKVMPKDEI
jgi:hypothetical protein